MADRVGYRLTKLRSHDGGLMDDGVYALVEINSGLTITPVLAGNRERPWTLRDVEKWLHLWHGEPK